MTTRPASEHPLDSVLRERLHLRGENPASLKLIRGLMHSSDAISRVFAGHPFVALRESEALLTKLDGLKGQDLIMALIAQEGGTKITALGLDHVPETGPVVIASTHPTGLFDFAAHAAALLHKRVDLKVVANKETEKLLGPDIIVPVTIDKQNRATSGAGTHSAMQDHLAADGALLIFGSGRVPDRQHGYLVEPTWRRGATFVSKVAQVPIVPAALNAQNSNAYYRLRAFARFISGGNDNFGAMIGSLRYTSELMEKLGGSYEVTYGAPLAPGTPPEAIKAIAETLIPNLYGKTA